MPLRSALPMIFLLLVSGCDVLNNKSAPISLQEKGISIEDVCRIAYGVMAGMAPSNEPVTNCQHEILTEHIKITDPKLRSIHMLSVTKEFEFLPTKDTVRPKSKYLEDWVVWQNFGAIFHVNPSAPMCLSIQAYAADATADSLFYIDNHSSEPRKLSLVVDKENIRENNINDIMFKENTSTIIGFYPREARTGIKSLFFYTCQKDE